MKSLDAMVAKVVKSDDWVSHGWHEARAAYDRIPLGDDDAIVDLMGLLIDEIQRLQAESSANEAGKPEDQPGIAMVERVMRRAGVDRY